MTKETPNTIPVISAAFFFSHATELLSAIGKLYSNSSRDKKQSVACSLLFFFGGIIDFDKQICINKLFFHNNLPIFCFKFVFHANISDSKLIVKVKIESCSKYISSAYFLILENIML